MTQVTVTHLDHMGDDLSIVNAARVSFAKVSERFTAADGRLLRYLALNGHWTPFAHPQISVHVRAPVFVRSQCFKSKVGFTENEVSRRYVDSEPEFFTPHTWRGRPVSKKQGSSSVAVVAVQLEPGEHASPALIAEDVYRTALEAYRALITGGVAPEQARMVLPQAMMTEWVWTGSLAAYARFCGLRLADDAQEETGLVAAGCAEILADLFPESWAALLSFEPKAAA